MKRVLIVHPILNGTGGGNVVAAWALQALRKHYQVTLATLEPIDYAAINRSFGTDLAQGDFELRIAPKAYRQALRLVFTGGALLTWSLTMRWAQDCDRTGHYDAILGTENEMDFLRRGLHYVHDPHSHNPHHKQDLRWFHGIPALLSSYHTACRLLARSNDAGLRRNLSLANSNFTAQRIRKLHGVDSTLLYPPVPGEFPDVAWEDRHADFVCIGRLHPAKRWPMAVHIVELLRERGHSGGLTLLGQHCNAACTAQLQALMATRPWFQIRSDLRRTELASEVTRHRYGLHTMLGEPFGIAPAELQRAGCLTFVHNSGGQVEIVGAEARLTFETAEDAAEKLMLVLENPELERKLRAHAAAQKERFTTERFVTGLRDLVERFCRGEI